MASFNRVILMGNLTRDPEVKYISTGKAVAELGLAINESYRNKAGENVEQTCFVDVTVWDRQAETCGQYLSKGSPVLVEGRLQLDQWENQQGEKRSKLRVRANRVQFLGSPRGGAESGDRQGAGTYQQPAAQGQGNGQAYGDGQQSPAGPPAGGQVYGGGAPTPVEGASAHGNSQQASPAAPAAPQSGAPAAELRDEDNLPF